MVNICYIRLTILPHFWEKRPKERKKSKNPNKGENPKYVEQSSFYANAWGGGDWIAEVNDKPKFRFEVFIFNFLVSFIIIENKAAYPKIY